MPPAWDTITARINAEVVGVFGQADPASGVDMRPVYIPLAGAPYAINGVFDNPTGQIEMNDPTSAIQSPKPILGCRSADFAAAPKANDRVYIPKVNATYVVKSVADDSHGGVVLELLVKTRHPPGYAVPGHAP
jgi:hypothetical protein